MLPTDRLVLIDLENVVGFRPKPRTLRVRITALLDAAGPRHHAWRPTPPTMLRTTPPPRRWPAWVSRLRVAPGPDAAETVLLSQAKRMQAEGCVLFTVCSSDHAFATLADTSSARIEVLIWHGQPVSAKLAQAADHVRRLPRPGAAEPDEEPPSGIAASAAPDPVLRRRSPVRGRQVLSNLAVAVVTGVGMTLGNRLADALVARVRRHRRS
jgi:hypothetical protein